MASRDVQKSVLELQCKRMLENKASIKLTKQNEYQNFKFVVYVPYFYLYIKPL